MRPSLPNLPSRVEPSNLVFTGLRLPIGALLAGWRTIPTERWNARVEKLSDSGEGVTSHRCPESPTPHPITL
jgi:hypothetical protein